MTSNVIIDHSKYNLQNANQKDSSKRKKKRNFSSCHFPLLPVNRCKELMIMTGMMKVMVDLLLQKFSKFFPFCIR